MLSWSMMILVKICRLQITSVQCATIISASDEETWSNSRTWTGAINKQSMQSLAMHEKPPPTMRHQSSRPMFAHVFCTVLYYCQFYLQASQSIKCQLDRELWTPESITDPLPNCSTKVDEIRTVDDWVRVKLASFLTESNFGAIFLSRVG